MKVTTTQQQPEFSPVTIQITFESQDEIDRLFAVTNYVPIQKIGGLGVVWEYLYDNKLYANYHQYRDMLAKLMK